MNEALFPYYERELLFMRQMAQEFRRQYPSVAPRLLLEANRSADSHVERLFQSFAFLAGRTQQRLADEFPEISDAFLQIVYPHYLNPIPSLTLLEFELDPVRAQMPGGFELKRGSMMTTPGVDGVACRFRTTSPVTLWPLRIAQASFSPPPFPPGVTAPPGAAALLRLQFEIAGPLKFQQLQLDTLRIYLHSEEGIVPLLYEMLFNDVMQVTFRPWTQSPTAPPSFTMAPKDCLRQPGFSHDDALFPYPPRAPLGHLLLTEYFTFPAKFFFVDLKGWKRVAKLGYDKQCEVDLFLRRSHRTLEQNVNRSIFRTGCTPAVNLFPYTIDNLELHSLQSEYPVVPDSAFPKAYEVYSIDDVFDRDPASNVSTHYSPFYSVDHDLSPAAPSVHWYGSRSASLEENDRGTDVTLNFVDLGFSPLIPNKQFVTLKMTCTNRDLPSRLAELGDALRFQPETAAPLSAIRVLKPPTMPLRPGQRRGRIWRIISHLTLNHLALEAGEEGLEAFRDLFRLYDFSDPEAGQSALASLAQMTADSIQAISSRRVIGQLEEAGTALFCRGVETTVTLDEDKLKGTGVFLFASLLERFLSLFVGANSFTELVVKTKQRSDIFRRWPPRPGELPTL
jgi:type VI secretion system protein ImpG